MLWHETTLYGLGEEIISMQFSSNHNFDLGISSESSSSFGAITVSVCISKGSLLCSVWQENIQCRPVCRAQLRTRYCPVVLINALTTVDSNGCPCDEAGSR